jgi:hypothetical protein
VAATYCGWPVSRSAARDRYPDAARMQDQAPARVTHWRDLAARGVTVEIGQPDPGLANERMV